MSLFRSEDMSYVQVLVPAAVAEEFADLIGREKCLQFTDLNEDFQPFQRKYTGDIIKIQEIERRLKAIEEQLDEYDVKYDGNVAGKDLLAAERPPNSNQIVENTARDINETFKRLKEQGTAERQLHTELKIQEDAISVLRQIENFLLARSEAEDVLQLQRQQQQEREEFDAAALPNSPHAVPLLGVADGSRDVGFKYLAGVVTMAQRVSFERQVFLTSRGNSFVQFEESGEGKMAFVVFFLGDQLHRSLRRLCQFMNIQICYESDSERSREELLAEAQTKRNDFHRIHFATRKSLLREMREIAQSLKAWKITLLQEKAIRITLNQFRSHQGNNVLRAEGWCPTVSKPVIQTILDRVVENKGVGRAVLTESQPHGVTPTHFETNDFTRSFQAIVDTYGVPRYKEFNPTVPTIVTFPFLFAVMYGDMFHGSCIFLFASFLVLFGKRFNLAETALADLYGARWVLFLMGAFAIYCGMIYNDAMSIMINGWNLSQWRHVHTHNHGTVVIQRRVYAVGVDPAWHGVDNQLSFTNSLKMKLSVIIGVSQMTFGLLIKLSNHIQERDQISIWFEFVPQMVFMISFFGYMIWMIFYKWTVNWRTTGLPDIPSLITVLIRFVLSPGNINDESTLYNKDKQATVQVILLLAMLFSIPSMLFIKPYLLKRHHENLMARGVLVPEDDEEHGEEKVDDGSGGAGGAGGSGGAHGGHGGHGGHEFVFSEVMIHQLIHTIEYVLGTISNTASYLRLWALSLAHAELSDVFYSKTIQGSMKQTGAAGVIFNVGAVFVFFMVTFGVLLVMDVLECFLHALRLHWVEFQNKFYYADGVPFQPFSYESVLKQD